MASERVKRRKRIHYRVRKTIIGTASRPRLCVFRSNKEIYCQIIDDQDGKTLASASSRDIAKKNGNKVDQAKVVGSMIGDKASELNINTVLFDRGGYLYHGRVKALAQGAREKGLKF